jgi:crossover junction endodeoxyribonuclease RuvC
MVIVGIDPGFSGAVAIKDGENPPILLDMPILKDGKHQEIDEVWLRKILAEYDADHVFLEKSQAMPGQGISSTARYMMSFGQVRGLCAGMKIPYTLVHPRTWKKAMMPDMPKEKQASIVRALQLFPDIELPRKKDHGKADALLLCVFGIRQLSGKCEV